MQKAGVAVVLLVLKLICGLGLDNAANSPDSEVESESWPRAPFARTGVLVAAIGSALGYRGDSRQAAMLCG